MLKLTLLVTASDDEEDKEKLLTTRGIVPPKEIHFYYEVLPSHYTYKYGARTCIIMGASDIYCVETLEEIEEQLQQINLGLWNSSELD